MGKNVMPPAKQRNKCHSRGGLNPGTLPYYLDPVFQRDDVFTLFVISVDPVCTYEKLKDYMTQKSCVINSPAKT